MMGGERGFPRTHYYNLLGQKIRDSFNGKECDEKDMEGRSEIEHMKGYRAQRSMLPVSKPPLVSEPAMEQAKKITVSKTKQNNSDPAASVDKDITDLAVQPVHFDSCGAAENQDIREENGEKDEDQKIEERKCENVTPQVDGGMLDEMRAEEGAGLRKNKAEKLLKRKAKNKNDGDKERGRNQGGGCVNGKDGNKGDALVDKERDKSNGGGSVSKDALVDKERDKSNGGGSVSKDALVDKERDKSNGGGSASKTNKNLRNVKKERNDKDGGTTNRGKTLNKRKSCTFAFVVMIYFAPVEASAVLHKPGQALPSACFEKMKQRNNDCLSRQSHLDFEQWYQNMNETCCEGFPGKDFQCLMGYHNDEIGMQESMIACVTTHSVPAHFGVRFQNYCTSEPTLQLYEVSDTKFREWKETWSWEMTHLYPTKEKGCNGIGQEVLCKAEEWEGDYCTCSEGFKPSSQECNPGFFAHAHCSCERMTCPEGHVASRNFVQTDVACRNRCEDAPVFMCRPQATTVVPIKGTAVTTSVLPPTMEYNAITAVPSDDGIPHGKENNAPAHHTSFACFVVVLAVMFL